MTILKTQNGGLTTLKIEGRLDTSTAPELETIIVNDLTGTKDLVLDFAALDYISSAGLRVILKAQKTMKNQGTMKIIHVNDAVMEVFDITGFSDILTIA